ncbi:MAG TPA: hypothetical protein VNA30_01170 [Mycobacteriales bacterium]|nr:hypothetical protein [Mycobacteriales bacterium]
MRGKRRGNRRRNAAATSWLRARWLWVAGAAALGGVFAGGLALRRGLLGTDAPHAQDPDELRAVVDHGEGQPEAEGVGREA